MIKFIICLSLLLNRYNCEEWVRRREVFEVNPDLVKEKEFTVKAGEEFIIKVYCASDSWKLLNGDERDTVTFIKIGNIKDNDEIEENEYNNIYNPVKIKCFTLYYFKANSKTKEPKLLKFTDSFSYLMESNPTAKLIIKINVV